MSSRNETGTNAATRLERKRPITERYQALLEETLPETIVAALGLSEGATYGYAIALAQVREAIKRRHCRMACCPSPAAREIDPR